MKANNINFVDCHSNIQGLMTEEEAQRLDTVEFDPKNKSKRRSLLDSQWWVPLNWACNVVKL